MEAVRTGPWKLHLKRKELYNLDTDIGEMKNVYAANPEVVKKLEAFANDMDKDLGKKAIGPGVRACGKVDAPTPLVVKENVTPLIP
jgi:hypothetical protein